LASRLSSGNGSPAPHSLLSCGHLRGHVGTLRQPELARAGCARAWLSGIRSQPNGPCLAPNAAFAAHFGISVGITRLVLPPAIIFGPEHGISPSLQHGRANYSLKRTAAG